LPTGILVDRHVEAGLARQQHRLGLHFAARRIPPELCPQGRSDDDGHAIGHLAAAAPGLAIFQSDDTVLMIRLLRTMAGLPMLIISPIGFFRTMRNCGPASMT
jgi:hypothetical protein